MSELSITTTQNVNINFQSATVGQRLGASCIDFVIKFAYLFFIVWIVFGIFKVEIFVNRMDYWSQTAIMIIFYSPVIFYSLIQESMMEGQTFGKRLLQLKVVKIEGYQASFGDYLIRWIFKIIDVSIIGLITLSVSKKTQRFGDMAAGTAVIALKNTINISHTILEDIGDQYVPRYSAVIKLSDNDARIIKETFQVASRNNDYEILDKLCIKIESVTGITNHEGNQTDFIRIVLKDYNFYTQYM